MDRSQAAATVATLTPTERHLFKQCRRAWDLEAGGRRNLEPIVSSEPFDVDRCVRDALAVYYYPGMWDWARSVVIPLVGQALERAMARESERLGPEPPRGFDARAAAARRLLEHYVEWAPTVERLAPVLVEVDFSADLPDPAGADSVLRTPRGQHVRYQGRLDLLGVDEHDAYWVTRHRVVREWTPLDALVRDEETVAACWAWEQYYIGMEIAGTIHNEMRLPTGARWLRTAIDLVPAKGGGSGAACRSTKAVAADAPYPSIAGCMPDPPSPWTPRAWCKTPPRCFVVRGSAVPGARSFRRAVNCPPRPGRCSAPRSSCTPLLRNQRAVGAPSPRRAWLSTRGGRPKRRRSWTRAIGRALARRWRRGVSGGGHGARGGVRPLPASVGEQGRFGSFPAIGQP